MDIGDAFFIVAILGIAILWVWAGYRANVQGELTGIVIFFLHLILAVGVAALLWVLLVYPFIDCTERLCGFESMLLWMILSLIILVVWPLIVVAIINKKFPKPEKPKPGNDHVLDDGV